MKSKKFRSILVTGGAGFIGSHVVDALLSRGDRVVVVDDFNDFYDPNLKQRNVDQHMHNDRFRLIKGDIRDQTLLEDVMKNFKPDCVVHLAARAGVRPSLAEPELYYDVNVIGTLRLFEAMQKHKIQQMVMASSSSVYGNRADGPFAESDDTDKQVSPYGATKKTIELIAHTYAHLHGIETSCLRFFTVYGPRNRPDMACYLFTDAIMQGRPITMYGDGNTGRDYTYVGDIVAGIIGAIDTPVSYEIVNLGNSSPVLLKDLIQAIETATGKSAKVETKPMQPGDVQFTFADVTKAKNFFSFRPATPLALGLEQLVMWYKKEVKR